MPTDAKRQAVTNSDKTVFAVKRLMGRQMDDPKLKDWVSKSPYKIVSGPNNDAYVQIGDKKYSPAEISALILQRLKKDAETYLGETVTDAVITVEGGSETGLATCFDYDIFLHMVTCLTSAMKEYRIAILNEDNPPLKIAGENHQCLLPDIGKPLERQMALK